MNGHQPKKRCNSCTKKNDCKKYKDGKDACKKYEGMEPMPPKTLPAPATKKCNCKQRTVLSVRDFAILYEIASRELGEIEKKILCIGVDREETKHYPYYQDLLRIRDKLGELNIEVETPSVEVEE